MILRTEIKNVQKCTYNYGNANVIGMKRYTKIFKYNTSLQNRNIEEMCCIFLSILNKCRYKYVPKKDGKRKHTKYEYNI